MFVHLMYIGYPIGASRVYMLIKKRPSGGGGMFHTGHQRPVLTARRLLRVVANNMSLCWISILLSMRHDEL